LSKAQELDLLFTPVFRCSFPHVFAPQKPKNRANDVTAKDKFGVMAIWTPAEFDAAEKARWMKIMEALNARCIQKYGKPYKDVPPNIKKPFHRGDEKAKYGWTDKQVYANLTSNNKPGIVAADGRTKIVDASGFYSGCYARATVNVYDYSNTGIGVALGLNNLMFVKDGERLDNRLEAEDEFSEFAAPEVSGGSLDDFLSGNDSDDIPF